MRSWAPLALIVLSGACAANPAPRGFLAPADTTRNDPYGAWVVVRVARAPTVRGELLAIAADSVHILRPDGRVAAVVLADVTRMQVAWYDSQWMSLSLASLTGAVSTISNGLLLVFTFPLWVIGGTAATASQSRAPLIALQPREWERAVPYARYPQGLPAGLSRTLPVKRRQ